MKTTGAKRAAVRYSMLLVLSIPLWVSAQEAVKPELLTPVQQRMLQEISLDFKDTPVDDVLMIMAKQADVDIIKSPKVEGTVTATLTDVPLSEALTNILEAHGYAYITTDNIIRVVPKDEIHEVREKVVSQVFRVTYANVKDVETALGRFISEQGAISSNPGTSNIIVTDTESKVKAISAFIEEIDRETPLILVEAKIYDVTSTENFDLGVEWQAGTATSYGSVPTGATLGSGYSTLGNMLQSSVTDPALTGAFAGSTNKTTATDASLRFGILNDHINLDAALRAAQEDIRAKLLASPRIIVMDNEEAIIKIVEEIPYQELTQSSEGGNIGTTEFRDVGVELMVTPHLTRDGKIRLVLNPKFSVRTGEALTVTSGSQSSAQPIVASREERTTALIQDGQTVVIGGLKKQDVSQQLNKVPLLGDIPLLGGLFRFEGEKTVNSELVIFITPQVVEDFALSEDEERCLANTTFVAPQLPETKLGND